MATKTEFKFLDKNTIHIISEIIVAVGITFYFSTKHKQAVSHIEELAQKIEQQEDHIQKLEIMIQQLNSKSDAIIQQMNTTFAQIGQNLASNTVNNSNINISENKTQEKPEVKQKPKVRYVDPPRTKPNIDISEESDDDEEIDNAIKEELEDLNE